MSQTQSHSKMVAIANPPAGGAPLIKYAKALKLVARQKARFRLDGRLEHLYEDVIEQRRRHNLRNGGRLVVEEFSGIDAFPGRAVFPPSPNVMRRGPLRPSVRMAACDVPASSSS